MTQRGLPRCREMSRGRDVLLRVLFVSFVKRKGAIDGPFCFELLLRDLSIECDRMMALMPRNAIYLFDVYLLAALFDRVVRVAFG
jgi:hypothetical protein